MVHAVSSVPPASKISTKSDFGPIRCLLKIFSGKGHKTPKTSLLRAKATYYLKQSISMLLMLVPHASQLPWEGSEGPRMNTYIHRKKNNDHGIVFHFYFKWKQACLVGKVFASSLLATHCKYNPEKWLA